MSVWCERVCVVCASVLSRCRAHLSSQTLRGSPAPAWCCEGVTGRLGFRGRMSGVCSQPVSWKPVPTSPGSGGPEPRGHPGLQLTRPRSTPSLGLPSSRCPVLVPDPGLGPGRLPGQARHTCWRWGTPRTLVDEEGARGGRGPLSLRSSQKVPVPAAEPSLRPASGAGTRLHSGDASYPGDRRLGWLRVARLGFCDGGDQLCGVPAPGLAPVSLRSW